jgi:hypothetical protein
MKAASLCDLRTGASEPQTGKECTVVVAYDDLAAGKEAMELVSWLSFEHGDLRFEARPWRFDVLDDPRLGQTAAADGERADVLILSASDPFNLPESVQLWLTQSLAHKQGSSAAIVALFGTKDYHDLADSPRIRFVQSAAKAAGLDFFAPFAGHPGPTRADSCDDWLSERVVPTLAQQFGISKPRQGWGIND